MGRVMRLAHCGLVLALGLLVGTARGDEVALTRLTEAVASHPDDPDLLFALAQELAASGRKAEAVERLETLVRNWPAYRSEARYRYCQTRRRQPFTYLPRASYAVSTASVAPARRPRFVSPTTETTSRTPERCGVDMHRRRRRDLHHDLFTRGRWSGWSKLFHPAALWTRVLPPQHRAT